MPDDNIFVAAEHISHASAQIAHAPVAIDAQAVELIMRNFVEGVLCVTHGTSVRVQCRNARVLDG